MKRQISVLFTDIKYNVFYILSAELKHYQKATSYNFIYTGVCVG